METLEKWFSWALAHGNLTSIILGGIAAYVVVLMYERYFMEIHTEPSKIRKQKGITFLLCWFLATLFQSALWWVLAPDDEFALRFVMSVITGALVFPVYPLIASVLSEKFPSIGSAWRKLNDSI